ncbi:MAG: hypothetical protein K2Q14_00975, partial [Gammaproteobacteria bacterium]|nr:hypothetical protein [Gammaproteobacteria bacterium]
FANAFFKLLGEGARSENDVRRILGTSDYASLEQTLVHMLAKVNKPNASLVAQTKTNKNKEGMRALTDAEKNSFRYLVRQLAAVLRVGLEVEETTGYLMEKRMGDIQNIKNNPGQLEAESYLVDLIIDHPCNKENIDLISTEIDEVIKKLNAADTEKLSSNITEVLKGLDILKSIITGTRRDALEEKEKILLGHLIPAHRLHQMDQTRVSFLGEDLATYLIQTYTRWHFTHLREELRKQAEPNALQEVILQENNEIQLENLDDLLEVQDDTTIEQRRRDAEQAAQEKRLAEKSQGFQDTAVLYKLIQSQPRLNQLVQDDDMARYARATAQAADNFRQYLFAANNIHNVDVMERGINDLSTDYLQTTLNPADNRAIDFYINLYLSGPAHALDQALQDLDFPELSLVGDEAFEQLFEQLQSKRNANNYSRRNIMDFVGDASLWDEDTEARITQLKGYKIDSESGPGLIDFDDNDQKELDQLIQRQAAHDQLPALKKLIACVKQKIEGLRQVNPAISNETINSLLRQFFDHGSEDFRTAIKPYWTQQEQNRLNDLFIKQQRDADTVSAAERAELNALKDKCAIYMQLFELEKSFSRVINLYNPQREHATLAIGEEIDIKLYRGLLVRQVGTKSQAAKYLEARLDFMLDNEGCLLKDHPLDYRFLGHAQTLRETKCIDLLNKKVGYFVESHKEDHLEHFYPDLNELKSNEVADKGADKSEDKKVQTKADTKEVFIAKYAPQHLAHYQYKRLMALLNRLTKNHDEILSFKAIGMVADELIAEQQVLEEELRACIKQMKTRYRAHSLFGGSEQAAPYAAKITAEMTRRVNKQRAETNTNETCISLHFDRFEHNQPNPNTVIFTDQKGYYQTFNLPLHNELGRLGGAVDGLVYSFADEVTLKNHTIYKLSTLLEMSFLYDANKNGILVFQEGVSLGNEILQHYNPAKIPRYLNASVIARVKEMPAFIEQIEGVLERHLLEVENQSRPVSTTAELFFRHFGTRAQLDRYRYLLIEQLVNQARNGDDVVVQRAYDTFSHIMEAEPKIGGNSYKKGEKISFKQSDFIVTEKYRAKLDALLASQEPDKEVNYFKDTNREPRLALVAGVSTPWELDINECVASDEQVRKARFAQLSQYLNETPDLKQGTADQFIERFKGKPLDSMINSESAQAFALAYFQGLKKGYSSHYTSEAKDEAEKLIAFFAPDLMFRIFLSRVERLIADATLDIGKGIVAVIDGFIALLKYAAEGLHFVADLLIAGLKALFNGFMFILSKVPDIAAGIDKLITFLGDNIWALVEDWLAQDKAEYPNLLLDYLCESFHEPDALDTLMTSEEAKAGVRQIVSEQTTLRQSEPGNVHGNAIIDVLNSRGVNNPVHIQEMLACSIRFDENPDKFNRMLTLFVTLDKKHGWYASCFAMLHIAQLCQRNTGAPQTREAIETAQAQIRQQVDNLLLAHKELAKHRHGFRHQTEIIMLLRASRFFDADVPHYDAIAELIAKYGDDVLRDEYRLKKVRELIEARDPMAAEAYVNKLAPNADIHAYMETKNGREALKALFIEHLPLPQENDDGSKTYYHDNNRWNPALAVFLDAFTTFIDETLNGATTRVDNVIDPALIQYSNRQRLWEITTNLAYVYNTYYLDQTYRLPVGTKCRFIRSDSEAFSFLQKNPEEKDSDISEALGSDDESTKELLSLLNRMLSEHLPPGMHDLFLSAFQKHVAQAKDDETTSRLAYSFLLKAMKLLDVKKIDAL